MLFWLWELHGDMIFDLQEELQKGLINCSVIQVVARMQFETDFRRHYWEDFLDVNVENFDVNLLFGGCLQV